MKLVNSTYNRQKISFQVFCMFRTSFFMMATWVVWGQNILLPQSFCRQTNNLILSSNKNDKRTHRECSAVNGNKLKSFPNFGICHSLRGLSYISVCSSSSTIWINKSYTWIISEIKPSLNEFSRGATIIIDDFDKQKNQTVENW